MVTMIQSALAWLVEAEHKVERYLLNDNKVDAVEAIPWVLCSAILWAVLGFAVDKNPYFVSTVHAVFLASVAMINLSVGHNELEYLAFYVMSGYFIADFLLYCLKSELYIFGLHHLVTMLASYRMINQRNWNETMFASSCWLVELSTPFLNHFKVSGDLIAAGLFFLTFFLLRIVYLSRLSWVGWSVAINRLEMGIILLFTVLNYYWFFGIITKGLKMLKKLKRSS